jgi:ring-1,2-phenylacetyl-CoA epoxidase subunit PaaC
MKTFITDNLSTIPLIDYTLHLADTTLLLAQRNAAWCAHGPILEQDIAITNISLDLIGQARNFYQYAATLLNNAAEMPQAKLIDEDSLAFERTEREFKNLLLAELPNGDWAQTITRQFLFSQYQFLLFEKLQLSQDAQLAAIAAKSIKETRYHLRWSSEWVLRLGDGTAESKQRMLHGLTELWPYTGEMFLNASYESSSAEAGLSVDCSSLQAEWLQKINETLEEATLAMPQNVFMQTGGKQGLHTEYLGFILSDMQYLQRTYPNSQW